MIVTKNITNVFIDRDYYSYDCLIRLHFCAYYFQKYGYFASVLFDLYGNAVHVSALIFSSKCLQLHRKYDLRPNYAVCNI